MKTKLKSANAFVRFLLNHGEKLGIVAVLAVAGLLIYKSLGRETLGADKQPKQLEAAMGNAKTRVETMTWADLPVEEQTNVDLFKARSGEVAITPVNSKDFERIEFDPRVIDPIKLRSDPVLVAVENVEVNPGSGLWMSADPEVIKQKLIEAAKEAAAKAREAKEEADRLAEEGEDEGRGRGRGRDRDRDDMRMGEGGAMGAMGMVKTKTGAIVVPPAGGAQMQGFEDIRQRSWVTVLAKVPIKQQFQMYEDALAGAGGFNPTHDQPEYLGYFVERAEVTEKGTGDWVPLSPVKASGVLKVMSTWPIQTPEMATPKYIHPLLTFPLPPMVMRAWGNEITHSDLPIQTPEEIMEEEARAMEEAQKPAEEVEDADNPFASVIERRTQPVPGGGFGMEGGGRMYGREGAGPPGGFGMEGRGMEGGRGGFGMEGGGMGGMSAAPQELPPYAWDGETQYLLFRYFDSTVTPGKRYRYRVRLAMIDVNAAQQPGFLAPEVSARLDNEKALAVKAKKPAKALGWRLTEWSEPSPVAVVPEPGLIYLATAKPPSQNNAAGEPEAKIVIKSLDSEFAAETALGDWFKRGAVLNRSENAQIIRSSLLKPDENGQLEAPPFDFLTGLTLVDFDGGEEMTPKNRKLLAPARALVMDSAGRLRLQNELDDQKVTREYDLIIKASDDAARQQRERQDEGGGRGGGRGGRGGREG